MAQRAQAEKRAPGQPLTAPRTAALKVPPPASAARPGVNPGAARPATAAGTVQKPQTPQTARSRARWNG